MAGPCRGAQYFGSAHDTAGSTETGYLLFYQSESWDGNCDPPGSEEAASAGVTTDRM